MNSSLLRLIFINLVVVFCFASFSTKANTFTKIEGTVSEKGNNLPIPYANVLFKNTHIGTITDINGRFVLQTNKEVDTLVVSAMGFKPIEIVITLNKTHHFDFLLEEETTELDEIVIVPGENPAHRVVRGAIKNKKKNNPEHTLDIACDSYCRTSVSFKEIDKKILDSRFFKKHKQLLRNSDTTSQKVSLPVFFEEKFSHNVMLTNPKFRWAKIVTEEQKGLGFLEETETIGYADQMGLEANFYDNYIDVMDRSFASPLHPMSINFYKFYLEDSIKTDIGEEYVVRFKPKNPKNLLFEGTMQLTKYDFALTCISVKVPNDVDINYVINFAIEQEMAKLPNGLLFWKGNTMKGDFTFLTDDMPISTDAVVAITRSTSYLNIENNVSIKNGEEAALYFEIRSDSLYTNTKIKNVRPIKLEEADLSMSQRIDSINNIWIVKSADVLTKMFINGYIEGKNFHVGPYLEMLKRNEVEGTRFNITGRTSEELLPNSMIYGHVGMGLKDEVWKYGIGAAYKLPGEKRRTIEASYRDDLSKIGDNGSIFYIKENMMVSGEDNLFASFFSSDLLDQLSQEKKVEVKFENEWRQGLSSKLKYNYKDIQSGMFVPFIHNGNTVESFQVNELRLDTRLSFHEKIADNYFRRYYLGSKYPIINLSAAYGQWDMETMSDEYWNVRAVLQHDFNIALTSVNYVVEAGKTFGSVPFPLLEVHRTDPSFGLARYSFNMMNESEYASDEFVSVMGEWHLNGVITHHLPLLKEMGIREVVSAKALWGRQANDNNAILEIPTETSELNGTHAEVGVGFENILQFFRVEGVWRLTNTESFNHENFGLRVRLDVKF